MKGGTDQMATNYELIELVKSQEGDAYKFGVEVLPSDSNPDAFDCAELVEWACARLGLHPTMPDGSWIQAAHCKSHGMMTDVEIAINTPGALLFRFSSDPFAGHPPKIRHVAISLGDGHTFEARSSSQGVGTFRASGRNWSHAALIPGLVYEGSSPSEQPSPPDADEDWRSPGASPATYNRRALGSYWNLTDIPPEWPGYAILLKGDLDHDLVLDPQEVEAIDWIAFSDTVADFQRQHGVLVADGKLDPITLGVLRAGFDASEPTVLRTIGNDLLFRVAEEPVNEPSRQVGPGTSAEEKRICSLWNRYGGAIGQQAQEAGLTPRIALAVFSVESGTAYGGNGLLIIRFEPHIFARKSGGKHIGINRRGQTEEWDAFGRAYEVDQEAALLSCSYGLPQLMGFNWEVTSHQSAREMVLAFQRSCNEQVAGFFAFVKEKNLIPVVKNEDWDRFAERYNGKRDPYSGRIRRAIRVVDSLILDGAAFEI